MPPGVDPHLEDALGVSQQILGHDGVELRLVLNANRRICHRDAKRHFPQRDHLALPQYFARRIALVVLPRPF